MRNRKETISHFERNHLVREGKNIGIISLIICIIGYMWYIENITNQHVSVLAVCFAWFL